jgi:hypothetical protein
MFHHSPVGVFLIREKVGRQMISAIGDAHLGPQGSRFGQDPLEERLQPDE